MVGFRAAAWTCFSAVLLAFLIGVVGLRGIGVVGQGQKPPISPEVTNASSAINLSDIGHDIKSSDVPLEPEVHHTSM
jgi:hypothetical protein